MPGLPSVTHNPLLLDHMAQSGCPWGCKLTRPSGMSAIVVPGHAMHITAGAGTPVAIMHHSHRPLIGRCVQLPQQRPVAKAARCVRVHDGNRRARASRDVCMTWPGSALMYTSTLCCAATAKLARPPLSKHGRGAPCCARSQGCLSAAHSGPAPCQRRCAHKQQRLGWGGMPCSEKISPGPHTAPPCMAMTRSWQFLWQGRGRGGPAQLLHRSARVQAAGRARAASSPVMTYCVPSAPRLPCSMHAHTCMHVPERQLPADPWVSHPHAVTLRLHSTACGTRYGCPTLAMHVQWRVACTSARLCL